MELAWTFNFLLRLFIPFCYLELDMLFGNIHNRVRLNLKWNGPTLLLPGRIAPLKHNLQRLITKLLPIELSQNFLDNDRNLLTQNIRNLTLRNAIRGKVIFFLMDCDSDYELILDYVVVVAMEVYLHRARYVDQRAPDRPFECAGCGWLGWDLVFGVWGPDCLQFAFDFFKVFFVWS